MCFSHAKRTYDNFIDDVGRTSNPIWKKTISNDNSIICVKFEKKNPHPLPRDPRLAVS
jgi:hypothetical protein